MAAIRTASKSARGFAALLLGLLLALRLLSPAGFMPAFDHGAVTIVVCPDAEPLAPAMASHHDHKSKAHHQPCPFAAASTWGALANDVPGFAAALIVGMALLAGRAFSFLERHRTGERPPLRGPPFSA